MSQVPDSHNNDIDALYQRRKRDHKMPEELKVSLQETLGKQLQSENSKNKLSTLLRHPAFAFTFSFLFICGLFLNENISIEQQFASMPESSTVSDIRQNEVRLRQETLPLVTAKTAPVNNSYSEHLEYSYDSEKSKQDTMPLIATQPQTQTQTQTQTQIVFADQLPTNQSRPQEVTTVKVQTITPQKPMKKYENTTAQQTISNDVESIAVQGATRMEMPIENSRLSLLMVKAIADNNIQLQNCQGQIYKLSLSHQPTAKVGERILIKIKEDKPLQDNLDKQWSEIVHVVTQIQCDKLAH